MSGEVELRATNVPISIRVSDRHVSLIIRNYIIYSELHSGSENDPAFAEVWNRMGEKLMAEIKNPRTDIP